MVRINLCRVSLGSSSSPFLSRYFPWYLWTLDLHAIDGTRNQNGILHIRRHVAYTGRSHKAYTDQYKIGYAADLLYPTACSLTKISLCLTYYRLFPSRADKIFCCVMASFVTLFSVTCLFLSLFQCHPIKAYWDPNVQSTCIDMRATLVTVAGLNSFSDFLIYLSVDPLRLIFTTTF